MKFVFQLSRVYNGCSKEDRYIDIPFDIPLPIVLDDSFSLFKYSSFSERCHVYRDRSQPTANDNSWYCKEENDEYAKLLWKYTIIFILTKLCNWFHFSGVNRQTNFWNFESITFVIHVVVTGKRVRRALV